jgi:hypothetical protein
MDGRLTTALRRRCLALSAEDRAELAGLLVNSLEGPSVDEERERLRGIIRDEYGVDILTRSREYPAPPLRAAAAVVLLERLPVSQSTLARWLGVRPCTVNYYQKQVAEALRYHGSFPELEAMYKKLLQNYDKTVQ